MALPADHGLSVSMSRAGECRDNAVVERFLGTLKAELVEGADRATRADADAAVGEYLEHWYNRQRRLSVLVYVSPVTHELLRLAA